MMTLLGQVIGRVASGEMHELAGQCEQPTAELRHRDSERKQDDRDAQNRSDEPYQSRDDPQENAEHGAENP
jgi:hypothetical protein